jgi:glycosyltransferase involved in cell wall biosynthesis
MIVSVIVLTYMHEEYILNALNSIRNQKVNFQLEIVIINDASIDSTDNLISEWLIKEKDKFKIKYFNNIKNVGMSKNFLKALSETTGKYVAILDGDDYWTDQYKLQKQVDFLENHPEYSHCWTRFNKLDEKTNISKPDSNDRFFVKKENGTDYSFETLASGWELGIQTLVFQRNRINIEKFKKFKYFRDIHVIVSLLERGNGFCINSFDAVYRIHGSGIHSGIESQKQIEIGFKLYREILKSNQSNVYIKSEFKFYFLKFIDELISKNKFLAIFSIIEFQFYFFDKMLFKHHLKKIYTSIDKK